VPGKPGAKTTAARPAAPKPGTAAKPSAVPTSAKPVASRPAAAAPRVGGQVPVVRPASVRTVAASTTRADTSAGDLGAPAAASDARFTRYRSVRDSVAGEAARAAAGRSQKLRVIVHLDARELAVLDGADTLLVAPVAIGRDTTIRYGTRTWSFDTPRGVRTVRRKNENPVWVPPDWHYVEVAARKKLKLAYLTPGRGVSVGGGEQLIVRGGVVGLQAGKSFTPLPTDEEIVFGNTLYVPPLGTKNRQIEGELGRFRLDMGDGYQLHGTPHEDTIGDAATHGCIRLYDEDIEWLYQHVPLGTSVYIF
jgi:lipoprotein-anchoring transpeptidase ErfK/SrfK